MKKYIKLYALLAMALFVGACEDELGNSFQPIQIVPGEEIQFGAVAGFETSTKDTRTIYGDINSARNLIEVNWVPGVDRIQIISPHTTGAEVAEYQVTSTNADQNNNGVDNKFEQYSKAKTLQRIGDAGLQWSNGESYEFYAMYPSHNQLQEVVTEVADVKNYGLKKAEDNGAPEGTMTGYLPVTQDPDPNNPVTSQNGVIKIHPDMRYAYMVAKEYYNVPESGAIEDEDDKIQLNFESLVTALEFELVVNKIGAQNDNTNSITIMALSLTSKNYDLCGKFCYTFPKGQDEAINKGEFDILNESTSNYKSINMRFGDGIPVVKDDVVKATFFVLPSAGVNDEATFEGSDLKLTVTYKVAGQPQFKTATIAKPVEPRKYTYFKNVKLPKVDANINGSKWFQALNSDIFVSQVSIPVAANTFANKSYNVTDTFRMQQTKKIEDLWNLGIRGFEMVNTTDGKGIGVDATVLGNMVASEKVQSSAGTFVDNVKLLRNKQLASFTYDSESKMVAGDPLILLCTYAATTDGYNPARYIQNLFASLDELVGSKYNGTDLKIDQNTFVQLTSNSTVKDVMGKICVIIRAADDERWATETSAQYDPYQLYKNKPADIDTTEVSKYGLTYSLPSLISSDWWNCVLLISDWGTDSWDSWHRRFGMGGFYKYATTATNFDALSSGKRNKSKDKMEKYIIGQASPTPETGNYYYTHDLSNISTGTAYVQDMVRIANGNFTKTKWGITYRHTVTWPASLDEKKKAIDGLFKLAVDTKGGTETNDVYINNLSGYFITEKHDVSWYPAYNIETLDVEHFPGNSKGGDYKACANMLTSYVYGILSGTSNLTDVTDGTTKLAEGPWGLVMMDYIGEVAKSTQLVDLIMMNNFRFPLAQKPVVQGASVQRIPLSDESVDINKNIMVTWE